MADWSQPTLTTGYSAFLSAMQARDVDAATQPDGGGVVLIRNLLDANDYVHRPRELSLINANAMIWR